MKNKALRRRLWPSCRACVLPYLDVATLCHAVTLVAFASNRCSSSWRFAMALERLLAILVAVPELTSTWELDDIIKYLALAQYIKRVPRQTARAFRRDPQAVQICCVYWISGSPFDNRRSWPGSGSMRISGRYYSILCAFNWISHLLLSTTVDIESKQYLRLLLVE